MRVGHFARRVGDVRHLLSCSEPARRVGLMAKRRESEHSPDAVARAARAARQRGTAKERRRRGESAEPLGGEVRRRDVVPMLVLHLLSAESAYGNRLIDGIESMTDGVLSVNPNTIYPLLREL